MVRKGFTLIELIFAIVVIAISVLSLPMMMQVNAKGMESNLVQEAIFASVAKLQESTIYVWDDDSLNDIDEDDYSRVLNVNSECNATTNKRKGHVERECLDNLTTNYHTTPNILSQAELLKYAIDHPTANIHTDLDVFIDSSSSSGYKTAYTSSLAVLLGNATDAKQFGNEANNQNIKELTMTIKKEEPEGSGVLVDVVVLRTYSANIGEVEFYSKTLP